MQLGRQLLYNISILVMLRNLAFFLLLPILNMALFWLWWVLPSFLNPTWLYGVHGLEFMVIIWFLVKGSKSVRQNAAAALAGMVASVYLEFWTLKSIISAMLDAVFDGLAD
ncbi:MAG: hypothetical protein EOP06_07270 [Proteobacteria bacterium]|nr:MAG: hypothetical protein EOP06_07270 [Pseudomonadota bacterium]